LDGEGLLTVALEVAEADERRLEGRLGVIPFDPRRHRLRQQVKAATYHHAKVVPQGGGWRAEVILDV
jgi:SHS2 domain-containing protein